MKVNSSPKFYSKCVFLENIQGNYDLRIQLISLFDVGVLYFNPKEYKDMYELNDESICRRVAVWNVFLVTSETLNNFSLIKLLEDVYYPHKQVIFGIIGEFDKSQIKKLEELKSTLFNYNCLVYETLKEIADKLNSSYY